MKHSKGCPSTVFISKDDAFDAIRGILSQVEDHSSSGGDDHGCMWDVFVFLITIGLILLGIYLLAHFLNEGHMFHP